MPAPELLVDDRIAKQCELAEALHIRRQAEICRQLYPEQQIVIQSAPRGGILIRTLAIFEGKLNRVVGCGTGGAFEENEARAVELLFAAIGLAPEVHLSPVALPCAFHSLLMRGYTEKGTLSTYFCMTEQWKDPQAIDPGPPVDVALMTRTIKANEADRFIEASITGFQDNGRSHALLGVLAKLATRREDTKLYIALVDGAIAGSAALAMLDTSEGSVAHLYLDSTLPAYRGRGVHRALIQARLLEARRRGLSLATIITRQGDGSARNAERAGMRLAYRIPIVSGLRS